MGNTDNGVIASIITRPPEIILCLKISVACSAIYVIFDSHPRPAYPAGSGFILNSSADATADYLDHLLAIDPSILSDPTLRWQAQLLGHFSSHILLPRNSSCTAEIDDILMEASVNILQLKTQVANLKCQESSLQSDNEYLNARVTRLEESMENADLKGKGRVTKPMVKAPSSHSAASKHASTLQTASSSASYSLDTRDKPDLARALQNQFDEEDRQLSAQHAKLLESYQTFECRICFDTLQKDHVAEVTGCDHKFCRGCLRSHVQTTIHGRRYPVSCPACIADNAHEPKCKPFHVGYAANLVPNIVFR